MNVKIKGKERKGKEKKGTEKGKGERRETGGGGRMVGGRGGRRERKLKEPRRGRERRFQVPGKFKGCTQK